MSAKGLIWSLLVWAVMILVGSTSLFHMGEPNTWLALQSYYSRILVVFISVSALGVLFRTMKAESSVKMLYKTGQMFYLISVIILCAALWVSSYTHFEGEFVRAEGETFNAFPTEYLGETTLFSSRESLPQVGMTFADIRPSEVDGRLDMVEADVLYAGRTTEGVLDGALSSTKYFISDWTLARIVDFGYAVRFKLMGPDEQELESALLPLKTYPPGTEDKFEATFPGYQFYVQVYPDHVGQEANPSTKTIYLNNPAIHLRITRNKDIVFDGELTPEKKLRFDNLIIAFPEFSYWVKVRMLRDRGLPVAAGGVLLLCVGLAMMVLGQRYSDLT